VTLVDKSDSFMFGFSELDVMFGRTEPDAVRLPYEKIVKPGVRVLRETVTAIDPEARRVSTDAGVLQRPRRDRRLRPPSSARRRRASARCCSTRS
jgi:sulfide:quinone oxidoreductase